MPTHEVDPISRIEGHLGVTLTTDASGIISGADVHANLWRGFENFLLGREINDAITFTQRICGVCPIPHATASTFASDAVLGYSKGHITFAGPDADGYGVPTKAVLIRNLVYASEFLMSHITHFYHLVAPSYVQGPAIPPWTPYFDDSYYSTDLGALLTNKDGDALPQVPALGSAHTWVAGGNRDVWDAVIISYVRALRIRRLTFEAGALFAGRMPMTSSFVAGGVTNDHTENFGAVGGKAEKFRALMEEVGKFIVNEMVPITLVLGRLFNTYDSNNPTGNGVGLNGMKAQGGFGAGVGRFLAWGAFPDTSTSGNLALPGGVKTAPTVSGTNFQVLNKADVYSKFLASATSVSGNLTEDIAHARYQAYAKDAGAYSGTAYYPGAVTRTQPDRANGYSYIKAPRWEGNPCEVGPFARMAVAGVYPVNGTTLWAHPAMAAAANLYFNDTTTGAAKLDIKVIGAQIVAALANNGLAALDGSGAVADWIVSLNGGLSVMDRLRGRSIEALYLVQCMLGDVSKDGSGNLTFAAGTLFPNPWIDELASASGATYRVKTIPTGSFQNYGCSEAPRGALMHQAAITNGKITAYQCIVPTTWNASPKDTAGNLGPIEKAMVGTGTAAVPFSAAGGKFIKQAGGSQTTAGGVEALRVAQSFDPCIACAVH